MRLVCIFSAALSLVACRTTSPSIAATKDAPGELAAASGVVPPQVERFRVWLRILGKTFANHPTPEKAGKALTGGDNRIAAFNLQALGRLYEADDPMFADWRKAFKKLEDAIGNFDKWTTVLGKAQASGAGADVVAKLKGKLKQAKTDLEAMLVEKKYLPADGSTPLLDDIDAKLLAFAWKDYAADKADRLAKLREELTEVDTATWDLTRLEEGNGVHELRRRLRWFLIEARVLNGLVLLKPLNANCPAQPYASLASSPLADSKYGKLPGAASETDPTSITPCLFLALVDAVGVIGELKDASEVANNANAGEATDTVDPVSQAKVQALLEKLRANQVFTSLSAELY